MAKLPGNFSFGLLILVAVVAISIYSLVNISNYGTYFGKPKYRRIELVELLSFGNFYNGREVCTRGYYVEGEKLHILKVNLSEDRFTRASWVQTGGDEIITKIPGSSMKAVEAELCGKFESARNGEFGEPPVWIAQITVSSYKTFGDVFEVGPSSL